MTSKFKIARASIYAVVLASTIVCLAIALYFQTLPAITNSAHFNLVTFAIFVCCASLFILFTLIVFSAFRDHNPISTRIELGCLGLLGTFWFALGAFLVECFPSVGGSEVVNVAGFSTETYQARYRALEALSLSNVTLVWVFLLFLFGMALKHRRQAKRNVWIAPVMLIDEFLTGGEWHTR